MHTRCEDCGKWRPPKNEAPKKMGVMQRSSTSRGCDSDDSGISTARFGCLANPLCIFRPLGDIMEWCSRRASHIFESCSRFFSCSRPFSQLSHIHLAQVVGSQFEGMPNSPMYGGQKQDKDKKTSEKKRQNIEHRTNKNEKKRELAGVRTQELADFIFA